MPEMNYNPPQALEYVENYVDSDENGHITYPIDPSISTNPTQDDQHDAIISQLNYQGK